MQIQQHSEVAISRFPSQQKFHETHHISHMLAYYSSLQYLSTLDQLFHMRISGDFGCVIVVPVWFWVPHRPQTTKTVQRLQIQRFCFGPIFLPLPKNHFLHHFHRSHSLYICLLNQCISSAFFVAHCFNQCYKVLYIQQKNLQNMTNVIKCFSFENISLGKLLHSKALIIFCIRYKTIFCD